MNSASGNHRSRWPALTLLLLVVTVLTGCVTSAPTRVNNICHIFDDKKNWYDDAKDSEKRWGSPIPVMMAIMHQESRFQPKAKPPRGKFLWVFPGPRPSSAYGFPQAKDSTWDWYQNAAGGGWASRHDFADAIDFIGWYNHISRTRSGIALDDPYHLYLAYHEGHGGFNRRTFRNKAWLKQVATKVSARTNVYRRQLASCQERLEKDGWWFF